MLWPIKCHYPVDVPKCWRFRGREKIGTKPKVSNHYVDEQGINIPIYGKLDRSTCRDRKFFWIFSCHNLFAMSQIHWERDTVISVIPDQASISILYWFWKVKPGKIWCKIGCWAGIPYLMFWLHAEENVADGTK